MTTPAYELQDITKLYPRGGGVESLNASIPRGKITGLLGPNGAGKTTVIRMLAGISKPQSGEIRINGEPVGETPQLRSKIGLVMDGGWSSPGIAAKKDIISVAQALGVREQRVGEVVLKAGLDEQALGKKFDKFSTGMKQRYAIATALLADPEIMILDEPTNGLDPQGIDWLRAFLRESAADGKTVILSSHLLSEVEQIVDRALIIDRKVLFDGELDELATDGSTLHSRFLEIIGR